MLLSLFARKLLKLSPKSDLCFPGIKMELIVYKVKEPRNVSIIYNNFDCVHKGGE